MIRKFAWDGRMGATRGFGPLLGNLSRVGERRQDCSAHPGASSFGLAAPRLVQIRSRRICHTGSLACGISTENPSPLPGREKQKSHREGGFFCFWRARQDYSAHPWASPFGLAASRLVQIRSRRICRTSPRACGPLAENPSPLPVREKQKSHRKGGFSVFGAPDRIRTCDLCLRRAALYPAELRALCRTIVPVENPTGLFRASCPSPLRGRTRHARAFKFVPDKFVEPVTSALKGSTLSS